MACTITYNHKKYTQTEFNEYFKSHFFEFAGDFLRSKQDIDGFKNFVNNKTLNQSSVPNQDVQDSQGNKYTVQESDIITYPTDFGDLNYIKNSEGDLVMVNRNIQENFVSLQEFPLNLPQNTKDMYMFTKECF